MWPAALSLFAFAWLELVQPDRTTLSVMRVWVLAWLVIMIIGAVVAGRRWIAAADPFEAYATTVAQLSPWRRADDGRLHVVNPLAGVNAASLPAGTGRRGRRAPRQHGLRQLRQPQLVDPDRAGV